MACRQGTRAAHVVNPMSMSFPRVVSRAAGAARLPGGQGQQRRRPLRGFSPHDRVNRAARALDIVRSAYSVSTPGRSAVPSKARIWWGVAVAGIGKARRADAAGPPRWTMSASFLWSARKHTVASAHQSVGAWHRATLRQGETAKKPLPTDPPFCRGPSGRGLVATAPASPTGALPSASDLVGAPHRPADIRDFENAPDENARVHHYVHERRLAH